jgi:hypothetical protein
MDAGVLHHECIDGGPVGCGGRQSANNGRTGHNETRNHEHPLCLEGMLTVERGNKASAWP